MFLLCLLQKDEEPPTIDRCRGPDEIILRHSQSRNVNWEEPLFSDNSNEDVFIESSHKPGDYFPVDKTTVTYTATDNSGNNASCTFNITIKCKLKKNI